MATPCIEWTGKRNKDGYGVIWNSRRGLRGKLAHRLIWEERIGPIPDGLCVMHKCDNSACVNVEHLALGTQRENLEDMTRKGRRRNGFKSFRGETNAASKIRAADVLQIRASSEPQSVLARRFGITQPTVSDIKRGKSWAWLQQ